MTPSEIAKLKATPGLYVVRRMAHPALPELSDSDGLLVASVDGKLYGIVVDNELADDGWDAATHIDRCLFEGGIVTLEQLQAEGKKT